MFAVAGRKTGVAEFGAGSQQKATASFAAPLLSGSVAGRVDGPGLKAASLRSPVRRVETRRFYRRRAAHDPLRAGAEGRFCWRLIGMAERRVLSGWEQWDPTQAKSGLEWATRSPAFRVEICGIPLKPKAGLHGAFPHSSQKRA